MSLYIKNIDTVDVSIDDLGISLVPGEEYDLTQDRPNVIASSVDLPAALTAGTISVLDPLDDVTPMSLSDAQEAVAAFNDSHFRIRGGELIQLDDVTLTSPTNGQILAFNGSEWVNQTPASGQNVYTTITGDTGSATADTSSDTLNIVGDGNKITTSVTDTPDTVQINWGGLSVGELTDVDLTGSPAYGNNYRLAYNATSGNWEPVPAPAPPPAGEGAELSIQLKWNFIPAIISTASIPKDATVPLITEGIEIWSNTITPQQDNSKIRIANNVTFSSSTSSIEIIFAVFRDNVCVGTAVNTTANKSSGFAISFEMYDDPGHTGPTYPTYTYSVRCGRSTSSGTFYINEIHNNQPLTYFGGTLTQNSYTIEELGSI
jgi:hypothetical protein